MCAFFYIVNMIDTTSTLKKKIFDVVTLCNLSIHDMRDEVCVGASDMCGAFNDLHVLFLKNYPYVYYIHCFVYRLQLTLVGVTKK